ncbi:hypothetical protein [Cohnella luojiensis]|uniref:Uncharacterized protein n=1 Tax=Cohnella luojiensis TaxID=652876 RepID=A0A4Y8M8B9_9BACL|nr:hypothetical protein [Cohnella luojiensis]TFE31814.1 hypothetical protein E2980_01730 [Cohnella luojiensis]
MPGHNRTYALLAGIILLLMGIILTGCMAASNTLPADEAFALSASALSGSESYEFDGEVSLLDPGGLVGSRAAYEGEVSLHGNLKMRWKTKESNPVTSDSVKSKPISTTAYRPLQLLEYIKAKSAVISYAEQPVPAQPVRLRIQIDENVATERVAAGLREDFKLLLADGELRKGNPDKANQILSDADQRLETALTTLKVKTVCQWTANPNGWFPSQLTEETVLSYTWDGKPFQEKRISETNFLLKAQDGTMIKSNK